MPNTWKQFSNEILGYEAPLTEINDIYVTASKVQGWLDKGKSIDKILLSWNAGESAKNCSKGKNKKGVKYNSCEYIKKGLLAYNIINKAEANDN